MALDKVIIGERIRYIRKDIFGETRDEFGDRCSITNRHVAQLERGEYKISLKTLDKISVATGVGTDFLLYGNKENKKKIIEKEILHNIIERADKDELQMYYKCATSINKCLSKKDYDIEKDKEAKEKTTKMIKLK